MLIHGYIGGLDVINIVEKREVVIIHLSTQKYMCDFKINNPEPVVVFFGPTACGKTSLSLRLMMYLHRIGYCFKTDSFLGTDYMDSWEESVIRPLNNGLLNVWASISPMLSRAVNHNGMNEFQILDMVGEYCKCPLPAYLNIPNKVILVFVLDFTNQVHYTNLFSEIYDTALAFSSAKKDFKTLFVVNKVDCMNMNTNTPQNLEYIVNSQLGNILTLSPFITEKNYLLDRRISKNYRVIPFSSYMCNSRIDMDGNQTSEYIISSETYPALLWKTIQDALLDRF